MAVLSFINNKDSQDDYQAALDLTKATFAGQSFARDLANEAPNNLNPVALAKEAKKLAKEYGDKVKVTILGEKEMTKLGMGCFMSVSQGSDAEGQLVVIEYYGKNKKAAKKPSWTTRSLWSVKASPSIQVASR